MAFRFSGGHFVLKTYVLFTTIASLRSCKYCNISKHDMNFESGHKILESKKTYLVYEKQDPFLNDSRRRNENACREVKSRDKTNHI